MKEYSDEKIVIWNLAVDAVIEYVVTKAGKEWMRADLEKLKK